MSTVSSPTSPNQRRVSFSVQEGQTPSLPRIPPLAHTHAARTDAFDSDDEGTLRGSDDGEAGGDKKRRGSTTSYLSSPRPPSNGTPRLQPSASAAEEARDGPQQEAVDQTRARFAILRSMFSGGNDNNNDDDDATEYEDDSRPPYTPSLPAHIQRTLSSTCLANIDKAIEKKARGRSFRRSFPDKITKHAASLQDRQAFLLQLAKTYLRFGAPSHQLQDDLASRAKRLDIEVKIKVHCIDASADFEFAEPLHGRHWFTITPEGASLQLDTLEKVHEVPRKVFHDKISAMEGHAELERLIGQKPVYTKGVQLFIAFFCAFAITPLAFDGSFLDSIIAGPVMAVFIAVANWYTRKRPGLTRILPFLAAFLVSAGAGYLSTIGNHAFCYSAIVSGSLVLFLPGFGMLAGILELLAFKASERCMILIVYTVALGMGIAWGRDILGLIYHPVLKTTLEQQLRSPTDNNWSGACYRGQNLPWHRQPYPFPAKIGMAVVFSIAISMRNGARVRSKGFWVALFISIAGWLVSYGISLKSAGYILYPPQCVAAIIITALGCLYSRIFRGNAFTVQLPGILFLVPSGLSASGGLADATNTLTNYVNDLQNTTSSSSSNSTANPLIDSLDSSAGRTLISRATLDNLFNVTEMMIPLVISIGLGIFVGRIFVYDFGGRRKKGVPFSL